MKFGTKVLLSTALLLSAAGANAGNGLYEVDVSGLPGLTIKEGATLWQPTPLYPRMALRRGLEGKVLVEYSVNPQGKAENIRILQSSPRGFFDKATVRALESASFGVAYQDGQAAVADGLKKRFIYRIETDASGQERLQVSVN
jgi:protein TonB